MEIALVMWMVSLTGIQMDRRLDLERMLSMVLTTDKS